MTVPRRRRTRRMLLLLAALVTVLLLITGRVQLSGPVERCVAYFRSAGAWPFFIAMALLPAIGFPLWPFTVTAGHVFGPTMGVASVIACAILAQITNMTLCYWLAAKALQPSLERAVRWLGYSLPELPAGSAWEITLLVRIVPGLPFFLQNYFLGLARVPFGIYLLVSTLVHAAFVAGTILLGDALTRGDPRALASGALLCAVAAVAIYRLRRRRGKAGPN